MSAAPLTLEYELTQDDMWASVDRCRARIRPSWLRRLGAGLAMWLLIDGWDRHSWGFTAMLLLVALELWTSPLWLYWLGWLAMKFIPRPDYTVPFHIETDDRGLRVRNPPRQQPKRFWWSRLSRVEEYDFGIELFFDQSLVGDLEIPWKAFASDEQRQSFLGVLNQHLGK